MSPPAAVGISKYVTPSFVNCQESPTSFHLISTSFSDPLSTTKETDSPDDASAFITIEVPLVETVPVNTGLSIGEYVADAVEDFKYPWLTTKAVVAIWVVLVSIDAVGAIGVPVSVGESDKTKLVVPVDVETPVPPLTTGNIPLAIDEALRLLTVESSCRWLLSITVTVTLALFRSVNVVDPLTSPKRVSVGSGLFVTLFQSR